LSVDERLVVSTGLTECGGHPQQAAADPAVLSGSLQSGTPAPQVDVM